MKKLSFGLIGLLTIATIAASAPAFGSKKNPRSSPECRNVRGNLTETLINPIGAPGDPLGRVLGTATGVLNGAETAIVVSFTPQQDGTFAAETVNVFVTGAGDTLVTKGQAVFTPISPTDVHDHLELEIQPDESTGKWAGTTGTIVVEGIGFNLFPPTPGVTQFVFQYRGSVCGLNAD